MFCQEKLTLVMGASIVMECILANDSRRLATVCIPPENININLCQTRIKPKLTTVTNKSE